MLTRKHISKEQKKKYLKEIKFDAPSLILENISLLFYIINTNLILPYLPLALLQGKLF